jgi:hypothetical protein
MEKTIERVELREKSYFDVSLFHRSSLLNMFCNKHTPASYRMEASMNFNTLFSFIFVFMTVYCSLYRFIVMVDSWLPLREYYVAHCPLYTVQLISTN